jgi:hypothetical protein
MFKYILVPTTEVETDAPMFATALAVARTAPISISSTAGSTWSRS